jgi:hypothetical protein
VMLLILELLNLFSQKVLLEHISLKEHDVYTALKLLRQHAWEQCIV